MPASRPDSNEPVFSPVLFTLALVALIWSSVLLFAGGFTTSIGAGMAFLDWPLSNGSLNPEGWTQDRDQFAEHSHRLAGKVIGLLSIAIAIAFGMREKRRGVRFLAYALVAVVVFQGLLGGLRVLLDTLNTGADNNTVARSFAIAHAMGAQAVVLMLATLVAVSAPGWFRTKTRSEPSPTRKIGVVSLILLGIAILVGAIMRHNGAGLAIQTFPAAAPDGSWIPDSDNFGVWVHFLHRTIGILGGLGVVLYALCGIRRNDWNRNAAWAAWAAVFLVGVQVWLGILILETLRNPHVTTLHMLNGAVLLATLWTSLCWSKKARPAEEQSPAGASALSAS